MRIQTIPPSSYTPDDEDSGDDFQLRDQQPDEPLVVVHSKDMRNSFFNQDFSITKPCYRMTQEELDAMIGPVSTTTAV
ncbi:hypothetical protein HDU81_007878 [Chytriomyces hyalinus]|nr:hypothetical protein HDU81_007878 [Chytriomyces hyalinus]